MQVAANHAQCNLQTWHIHHLDYIRRVRKANQKDNKEGVILSFFVVLFPEKKIKPMFIPQKYSEGVRFTTSLMKNDY